LIYYWSQSQESPAVQQWIPVNEHAILLSRQEALKDAVSDRSRQTDLVHTQIWIGDNDRPCGPGEPASEYFSSDKGFCATVIATESEKQPASN
jgi:hypothetical protein